GAASSESSRDRGSGVPQAAQHSAPLNSSVPNGQISARNCAWRSSAALPREDQPARPASRVVTYREYVTHRTAPRELAQQIIERSFLSDCHSEPERRAAEVSAARFSSQSPRTRDRKKIDATSLSPDAFARRTDEASIAEQMGDVFAAAGFPRPIPADNDRVGGWMLMYQMLDAGEWLLTDNCIELIRTLPNLVRDPIR